jgi:hypothetical protein
MVIAEAVNKIKGVNTSFIDHHDAWCLCYVGWGPILKKHFKLLLARYTFNYFFEFDEGHVNMWSLCSTLNSEAINVPLVNATNISLIRQSLLSNLFNATTIIIEQVAFLPIHLLITPMLSLTKKKLISLGHLKHLSYYLEIPGVLHVQIDDE